MNAQDKEIAMLKSLVTSLTQEIEDLKLKSLVGQANIGIPAEFTGNSSGASPQTNPLPPWRLGDKLPKENRYIVFLGQVYLTGNTI